MAKRSVLTAKRRKKIRAKSAVTAAERTAKTLAKRKELGKDVSPAAAARILKRKTDRIAERKLGLARRKKLGRPVRRKRGKKG